MFDMLKQNLPFLLGGAKHTFVLSVLAMVISILVGLVFGLMRLSQRRWLRTTALAYVEVWRGVPMIVSILFIYFALPEIIRIWINVEISSFTAMLIACVFWTSANAAEIIRGAIQAIPFGQTEAAEALGMTYVQRMRLVIMPQAVKIMIPPMIGLFTLLLKGTAIGFIIEYRELIRVGQITIERLVMAGRKSASIEIYTVVMIIYFIMCYPLSRFSLYYERKLTEGKQ
ncbi:MAG: amino acid ABC transporter permease [Deltaproteobacteria bacterium]|nr:amino acid ABC transporter permease [Deltaproteobacteria bacterium]MBW2072361.1 amino acid ABC transporter permease [Deltaproteobacteria bacterium]